MNDQNRKLFETLRDHLNEIDLKNSEQFDRAILTLSSSGLALSVGLTSFIVPFSHATHQWLMLGSWLMFLSAIISTVVSFMTAKKAIWDTRDYAQKYYLDGLEEYGSKISLWSVITYRLNVASATLFVFGVILITLFVALNLTTGDDIMSKENKTTRVTEERGHVPTTVQSQGPKTESTSSNQNSDKATKNGS